MKVPYLVPSGVYDKSFVGNGICFGPFHERGSLRYFFSEGAKAIFYDLGWGRVVVLTKR